MNTTELTEKEAALRELRRDVLHEPEKYALDTMIKQLTEDALEHVGQPAPVGAVH
jgi:hypothetical protein